MGTSLTTPNDWMIKNGQPDGINRVIMTNRGWELVLPNGQTEVLHAHGGLSAILGNAPTITGVSEPIAGDYSQATQDLMEWTFTFDENVFVTPVDGGLIIFNGASVVIPYVSGSGTNTIVFQQTADNLTIGTCDGVRDPGLSLGTGGDEYMDAEGTYAETATPTDYVATVGVVIVA